MESMEGPVIAAIHFAKQPMFQAPQQLLKEALKLDSEIYGEVYRTKDFKEGVTAFLEKRKPVFRNQSFTFCVKSKQWVKEARGACSLN